MAATRSATAAANAFVPASPPRSRGTVVPAAIVSRTAVSTAPQSASPAVALGADKSMKETVKEELSDAAITTRIKTEFAKDKEVSAMKISVDTEKGVVKLSGSAKSKAEADKAEQIAKSAKGVVSVKDDIKVGAK